MRNDKLKAYWAGYRRAKDNVDYLGLEGAYDEYYIPNGQLDTYYRGYYAALSKIKEQLRKSIGKVD